MQLANGEYTMDKVARMRGMDDQGDIPLQSLFFNRGQGVLGVLEGLPEHVLHKITSFVPRDQTGFDMMFAVPPEYFEVLEVYPAVAIRTDIVILAHKICKIGLNEQTYMRIKWLVAEGPWPAGTNFVAKKGNMQIAFQMLLDLIKLRTDECGLNDRTHAFVLTDVTVRLSYYCFHGIHGWLH